MPLCVPTVVFVVASKRVKLTEPVGAPPLTVTWARSLADRPALFTFGVVWIPRVGIEGATQTVKPLKTGGFPPVLIGGV